MYTRQFTTPIGTLTALVDDHGVVRASGFTAAPEQLSNRIGLGAPPPPDGRDDELAWAVRRWTDGDATALDVIPTAQDGTPFQHQIWDALCKIPAGMTASYAELARTIGRPQASRAVGSACGHNLLAPFVPCHRAIRSDGSLGGYAYGLEVKKWLLAHELGYDIPDATRSPATPNSL